MNISTKKVNIFIENNFFHVKNDINAKKKFQSRSQKNQRGPRKNLIELRDKADLKRKNIKNLLNLLNEV